MLMFLLRKTESGGRKAFGWVTGDRTALLSLSAIMMVAGILARPTDDFPLIDDWTYAWSVEHFLKTGGLRVLDWSGHYPLVQIVWAGLFGYIFGFSHYILRLSTLALAWVGLLAFFFTLRRLGLDSFFSALGTLALLFNPVFFVLGYSFMTDIPFVSVMNLAILSYVLWWQRRSSMSLCLGGIFAVAAFLIRQIGAILPLLPLILLLLSRISKGERRVLPKYQWLLLVPPFLGIVLALWWTRSVHGLTSMYLSKAEAIKYITSASWWLDPYSWWTYFQGMVLAIVQLGFVLWPLAMAGLAARSRRLVLCFSAIMVLVAGVYIWHFQEIPNPINYGETFSLEELGASRPLIPGEEVKRPIPGWIRWALLSISLSGAVFILAAFFEGAWRGWANQPGAAIVVNGLWQFVAIEVLWLYYDRYYLPLLPGLIALLMSSMRQTKITKALVVVGLAIVGAISVSGTMDNFRFNRAVADARLWLLTQGVVPWQIDAGYVLNGWWLYAHPENLQPGARPRSDVPFVTSSANLPYKIANSPLPSYTAVREFTWRSLWAASDRIYVLRKLQVTPYITAVPNPVPAGGDGATTINWSLGDGSIGQVYVSNGGTEKLLIRGAEGSENVDWIQTGQAYEFRLYAGTQRARLLGAVTVTRNKE